LEIEKMAQLANQVRLVIGDLAVREDHPPHHLRQNHPLTEIVSFSDQAGELEVINGPLALDLCEFDELRRRVLVKAELQKERAGGDAYPLVRPLCGILGWHIAGSRWPRVRGNALSDEASDCVKHGGVVGVETTVTIP
jgi:hypothetical protein